MKLFLVASSPLQSYVERLLPHSVHQIEAVYLYDLTPASVKALLSQQSASYDAILFADGAAVLGKSGLTAPLQLIVPRVHNAVSLLMGGAVRYRDLFSQEAGGVCWRIPGCGQELFFSPKNDCQLLCYLSDTRLGLPDGELAARISARQNGWDFLNREADLTLLENLLLGNWANDCFLTVPAGQTAHLTYTSRLLEAGG